VARHVRAATPMKKDVAREREIEKRAGIVRDPGEPRADAPSDLPEHQDVHPQDVNDFHGDPERDRAKSDDEPGPTGSTPR
jgi:hypothetical protein